MDHLETGMLNLQVTVVSQVQSFVGLILLRQNSAISVAQPVRAFEGGFWCIREILRFWRRRIPPAVIVDWGR